MERVFQKGTVNKIFFVAARVKAVGRVGLLVEVGIRHFCEELFRSPDFSDLPMLAQYD